MPSPSHIGVLGGGISGLAAAFHLSRKFPQASLTLIERSSRLGGWIRSERVEVKNADGVSSSVLLESGPRTLRPNSLALLELINLLNLQDSVITTPKSSAAARRRFILDPSYASSITSIPSGLFGLISSPLGFSLLVGALTDIYRLGNRPEGVTDESVDSFLSRRFGPSVARTFGSALVHGVYAADSRQLSVRAAFSSLWEGENESRSSVLGGMFVRSMNRDKSRDKEYDVGTVRKMMDGVSVYSYKDGLSMLVRALEHDLRSRDNVRILTDTSVDKITPTADGLQLTLGTNASVPIFSHLVSALRLPDLGSLLPPTNRLPHLNANKSSSVTVLNLVFRTPKQALIHPPGFGYLTSRPVDDYHRVEGPGILGTVFDSSSLSAQDAPSMGEKTTKITVMLGGPYARSASDSSIPIVLNTLAGHLGIPVDRFPEPVAYWVNHHEDCIPTYAPGHVDRMDELREELGKEPWNGRLAVIGSGVGGVSVGDCVEAGRSIGREW